MSSECVSATDLRSPFAGQVLHLACQTVALLKDDFKWFSLNGVWFYEEFLKRRLMVPLTPYRISDGLNGIGRVAKRGLERIAFGRGFAEFDRLLAAFAGPRFVRRDGADVAIVIKVVQSALQPGLKFDDFDETGLREEPGRDLQFALAVTFVHPDGGGSINRQEGIELAVVCFQRVNVAALFAIWKDLIWLLQFFSEANDATANRDRLRLVGRFRFVLSRGWQRKCAG